MRRIHLLAVCLWGCAPLLLTLRWVRGGELRSWTGLALVAFTALWWAAAVGLYRRRPWAPGLAALLAGVPLLLGLVQSARRILFIVDRGGLESVGGRGSPLAFLVGWGEEALVLLIPGLVLTGLGAWTWREERAPSPASEARLGTKGGT
ncbi:MAG: hypothetical protein GWM92_20785 [Gemmatimonadetes bacterium]|nr:hypothetical protein [Gemmatimonadota bacterium]NIR81287.1 hypothetical protein [Gemmatimonadota bacterium]NIT90122.1 hypothetical protein [Gemmatimonadota bacterium]NIU33949.1 hypothetical protein [Gemmatimonadota bacterium]NIU38128.1 hypothetical protein [Gemmatimonadota bacterium]